MKKIFRVLSLVVLVAALLVLATPGTSVKEIKKNLEFTCVHEKRPSLSEETQQLYNYALHRDLNHM